MNVCGYIFIYIWILATCGSVSGRLGSGTNYRFAQEQNLINGLRLLISEQKIAVGLYYMFPHMFTFKILVTTICELISNRHKCERPSPCMFVCAPSVGVCMRTSWTFEEGFLILPLSQSFGDVHGQGRRLCSCTSQYASSIARFVQTFTSVHFRTEGALANVGSVTFRGQILIFLVKPKV